MKTPQQIEEMAKAYGVNDGYYVSANGYLYNDKTKKILSGHVNKKGYVRVFVKVNGVFKNVPMHRLILESFKPKPSDNHEVNHIDFNKSNNKLENLEWVTRKENIEHNFIGEKIRHGENCNLSKMDEFKVLTILTLKGIKGYTGVSLSTVMKVHHTTVQRVLKGVLWKRIYQSAV